MAGGTWDWDLETGRMAVSPEMERLLGMKVGSFGGSLVDFLAAVHIDHVEPLSKALTSALHDHGALDLEYRALAADQSTVWVRVTGRVARDLTGVPVGMIGEVVDVSYLHIEDDHRATTRRSSPSGNR